MDEAKNKQLEALNKNAPLPPANFVKC